jgi:hypothetical protein
MLHRFSTENLARVFSKDGNDFDGFKGMIRDYTHNREVFDENGSKVTNAQINDKINTVCFDILNLDPSEKPSKRDIKRAMKKHGMELFEVLEDAFDFKVSTGFKENEFFNEFVDNRNIKDGDRNDFYSKKDVILTVAKVSGDHHDLNWSRVCIA